MPEPTSPQSANGQPPIENQNATPEVVESPREQAIKLLAELEAKNERGEDGTTEPQEPSPEEKPKDEPKQDPEDKKEEPQSDDGKDQELSKAIAAVNEKEARFQGKKRELEERARAAEQRAIELQDTFNKLRANPLEFMSQLGLDLDSVLRAAAKSEATSDHKPSDESNAMAEVQRLRKELADKEQRDAEASALSKFVGDINDHVSDNKDKYPLILSTEKAQDQILELIDGYYRANKKILPIEEAAGMVESELQAMADKWLDSEYVKAKIQSISKANGSDGTSDGAKKTKEKSPSLSNALNSATDLAELSSEQRRAMAIKMFAEMSTDDADMG